MSGIALMLIDALVITGWMIYEYYERPGHFDVKQKLIGEIGVVKTEISAHQRGKVYVYGAYWDAVCEQGMIAAGREIEVVAVKDKFLVVKPVDLTAGEQA